MNRRPTRSLSIIVAAIASLLPAAIASAQPELELVWPPNGVTIPASGSGVKIEVEGFQFDCTAIGGVPFPGRGHYHVLVDGIINAEGCEARTSFSGALAPGARTIAVELVQNDHTSLTPQVRVQVSVTAEADGTVTYTPASMVTGVARTEGAVGSFFKTTLWTVAPSSQSKFRMQFIPALGQPAADFPVVGVTIPATRSFAFADLLRDAFGVTGGSSGNVVISVAA
ncbi:MAG TPA: hypothetical protein VLD39_17825, partial [Gammaproteobacteria bacterium]|nr:hypothetical protein [Gammaproteobacteria bacterium]